MIAHTPGGAFVARHGGEKAVALSYHPMRDDGDALAERWRTAIAALGIVHEDSPHGFVTASLGGATVFPTTDGQPETLVETADQALYAPRARAAMGSLSYHRSVQHHAAASA